MSQAFSIRGLIIFLVSRCLWKYAGGGIFFLSPIRWIMRFVYRSYTPIFAESSFCSGTRKAYNHGLPSLCALHCGGLVTGRCLGCPASLSMVLAFVTWLFQEGRALSSIRSNLSAISFWHESQLWHNPTKDVFVQKLLSGIGNLSSNNDL